ncbi:FMN-linked oxidoreductase [Pilatotrama ljubarskyi]|nr:FMN-linked oxidoreductase [Pilatotrama ljubarskyi]
MVRVHTLHIEPPVVNASCAWASDYEQLRELYDSAYTGAVITRTATFNGFSEDANNTFAFAKDSITSVNSYGYSPHPLSKYLDWVYTLLTTPCLDGSPPTKPIIISITASTPTVLAEMVENIQSLRKKLRATYSAATSFGQYVPSTTFVSSIDPATLVGIELNTSCPNIKDAPPPSYTFTLLLPLLDVLSSAFYSDPSLTIGLKLPPYLYSTRFAEVVRFVHTYTREIHQDGQALRSLNPFAYLACTNTLGSCLLFSEQMLQDPVISQEPSANSMETDGADARSPPASPSPRSPSSASSTPPPQPPSPSFSPSMFALPTALGGMGGESIHPISLGNVYTFARMLAAHPDPAMRRVRVFGIGGVTSAAAAGRMRAAGASVVGCATLLGREGVRAFEIIAGHS